MASSCVSSYSTPKTFVHPSIQIRSLADKTIAYLEEKPISERICPQQTEISLSSRQEHEIREEWRLHRHSLLKKKSAGKFSYLSKGSSHLVFTHEEFPKWVFKPMRARAADQQAAFVGKAISLVDRLNLHFVRIPPGKKLPLEEPSSYQTNIETLYIEERLPIAFSELEYEELYDRLLSYFSNNATETFRSNFLSMIRQAAVLIQKSGYWDVGPLNGPLLNSETGAEFLFTDFEQQEDGLLHHASPLTSLLELFPLEKVKESLTSIFPKLNTLSKNELKKLNELELMHSLKAKALCVWDSKGWTLEETSHCATVSTKLTDPNLIEIIDKINRRLTEKALPLKCFTKSRCVRLIAGVDFGTKHSSLWSKELLTQLLESLRSEATLINWHFKSIGWHPDSQQTLIILYC